MSEPFSQSPQVDLGEAAVAALYAKALLGALDRAGDPQPALAELDALVDELLEQLPDFRKVLSSLRVPHEEKEQLLDKALAGRIAPLLLNFLKVLSRHGRLALLPEIRRAARRQWNAMQGRTEVRVTTACPLDEAALKELSAGLERSLGGPVHLDVRTHPGLIGGMVVRVGDTLYDGSVAGRLRRLRDDVMEKTFKQVSAAAGRFVEY